MGCACTAVCDCLAFFDCLSPGSAVILLLPLLEAGIGAGLTTDFSAGRALTVVGWFSDVVDGCFVTVVVFEFAI